MGRELIGELMSVVLRKIETQGDFPTDAGAIEDIVEEVLDEFLHDGLITDDTDINVLKAEMINRLKDNLKTS